MAIACQNLHYSYAINCPDQKEILKGVNHCFKSGQAVLITGPTGSGKSTLLHLLAGLMRPTKGRILADEEPVSRWIGHHLDLWRRNVGLVFQTPYLLPNLTVMENVAAPLIPRRISRKKAHQRVSQILAQLDLSHLATQFVQRLSGGERQRITLARALIVYPHYLLADEPTAFQDKEHASTIMEVFEKERRRGCCVVACSHDERLLQHDCFDEILKLTQGRLEPL